MPHFSSMIGSDGPVIDLAVAVGETWQRHIAARGLSVPSPAVVRALIDTGSDLSVVHPQVLQQLGVQPTGSVRIRRPGTGAGFRQAPMCDVQLAIGDLGLGAIRIPTRVVSVIPSTPTVLALIGRDLLKSCTVFYNGPRGELTLSI
jgi:predicted aspartyl protease